MVPMCERDPGAGCAESAGLVDAEHVGGRAMEDPASAEPPVLRSRKVR